MCHASSIARAVPGKDWGFDEFVSMLSWFHACDSNQIIIWPCHQISCFAEHRHILILENLAQKPAKLLSNLRSPQSMIFLSMLNFQGTLFHFWGSEPRAVSFKGKVSTFEHYLLHIGPFCFSLKVQCLYSAEQFQCKDLPKSSPELHPFFCWPFLESSLMTISDYTHSNVLQGEWLKRQILHARWHTCAYTVIVERGVNNYYLSFF